jgi:hypothetical protein
MMFMWGLKILHDVIDANKGGYPKDGYYSLLAPEGDNGPCHDTACHCMVGPAVALVQRCYRRAEALTYPPSVHQAGDFRQRSLVGTNNNTDMSVREWGAEGHEVIY